MSGIEDWIKRGTILFGGIVLCLMMVQVVVDVFLRAILGAGVPATPDLVSKYFMVTVSFLPVAYTEVERRHIEATIFTDKLKGRAMQAIYFLGFAVALTVFLLLTYGTLNEALLQTKKGAYIESGVIRFVTWPSYWILPISFGAMALVMAIRVLSVLRGTFADTAHDPMEELSGHVEEDED